jgi:lysophospholipid acyltransferase (LPLAT)-like uncharacterized protein
MMRLLDTWWRRIRKSDTLRGIGCWLVAQYIRLAWATGRWEIRNANTAERYWREGKPFVIAFWHGRLLILPAMWPTSAKISMLISMHRDGELIARAIGYFGHGTVRGSAAKAGSAKDRGGVAALRGMLKALKSNEYVGITPDGPRGPRMRATDGIVTVARMAGVPILPCSFSARSRYVFKTWDRFVLPLPFSRGVIVWGEPIFVAREADGNALETARLSVEAGLNAVTNQADEIMGVAPVEPDPAMAEGAVA